jgi:hypothetical protein
MAAVICYSIILVFAVIEGTITSWLVSQRNIHDNVHWTSSQRDRIRYLW